MKSSCVIRKIAGTESTAKITSANSTATRQRNSGVHPADQLAGLGVSSLTKNFSSPEALGHTHVKRASLDEGVLLHRLVGAVDRVPEQLEAREDQEHGEDVEDQAKFAISVAPSAIITARSTITPMMPQNRTRC